MVRYGLVKWGCLLLCALAVVGCGRSERPISSVSSGSSPAAPPAPEWAVMFKRCAGFLGKSENDVVTAIGPPDSTFVLGDRDRYDYNRNGTRMQLTFQGTLGLTEVALGFDPSPSAKDVWEALNGPGTKPDTFQANDERMADYWRGGSPYDAILIALNGTLTGAGPIQVNGKMTEPILKGEKRFDTGVSGYVVGPLSPNPNADWRSVKVDSLQTGKHKSGMFTGNYGPDHPIFQNGSGS